MRAKAEKQNLEEKDIFLHAARYEGELSYWKVKSLPTVPNIDSTVAKRFIVKEKHAFLHYTFFDIRNKYIRNMRLKSGKN